MACVAITIGDQLFLSNLITYAVPLAAIIFITLGFLTPLLADITGSPWFAAIPIVIALGLGVGLFGRGNVASGDLTLDDVATVTTTAATGGSGVDTTAATTTTSASVGSSGSLSIPADLADSYTVATGVATYSVEEELQGLATVGVGTTESVSGSIVPGGAFSFTIDLQSFASDQNRRDGRVREWFQEFPEGTFSGESFALPASAEVGEVVSFEVTGDMTVNGITLPATWAIDARIEADGSLSVTGETFIVLSDFDVPVMNSGFIVMEDGATIEVAFSATP